METTTEVRRKGESIMVLQIGYWKCEVCESIYWDQEKAHACEQLGQVSFAWPIGTRFGPDGEWTVKGHVVKLWHGWKRRPRRSLSKHVAIHVLKRARVEDPFGDVHEWTAKRIRHEFGKPHSVPTPDKARLVL